MHLRPTAIVALVACAWLLVVPGCDDDDGDVFDDGTVTVGKSGSEDFDSIQAALDAAPAGTRIEVAPGTYAEEIDIDQSVELIGASARIELPSTTAADQPVIDVENASDVTLSGFSVRGPADGIVVRGSSRVRITAVISSGNGDEGVDVRASSDVEVSGTFENNLDEGIHVQDGSQAVTVHSSVVRRNAQDGIKLESTTGSTLRDNTVSENGDDGIHVGESTGAQLIRNTITDNPTYGIHLHTSPDTVLIDNTVSGSGENDIEID